MGKAWPPERLRNCSHLIWCCARGFARIGAHWPGRPRRGYRVWVCVLLGDLPWLGGRSRVNWSPPQKPRGARGRGPGLPAGSTA